VALDAADLEETEDGYKITIHRSKTDQEGHGVTIAIARGVTACPVKAVKAWLQAAGISEGPLLRPIAKGGRLIPQRLKADRCATSCRPTPSASASKRSTSAPIPCVPASRRLPDQRSATRRFRLEDAGRVTAHVD
jgi:hypothetical protein